MLSLRPPRVLSLSAALAVGGEAPDLRGVLAWSLLLPQAAHGAPLDLALLALGAKALAAAAPALPTAGALALLGALLLALTSELRFEPVSVGLGKRCTFRLGAQAARCGATALLFTLAKVALKALNAFKRPLKRGRVGLGSHGAPALGRGDRHPDGDLTPNFCNATFGDVSRSFGGPKGFEDLENGFKMVKMAYKSRVISLRPEDRVMTVMDVKRQVAETLQCPSFQLALLRDDHLLEPLEEGCQ